MRAYQRARMQECVSVFTDAPCASPAKERQTFLENESLWALPAQTWKSFSLEYRIYHLFPVLSGKWAKVDMPNIISHAQPRAETHPVSWIIAQAQPSIAEEQPGFSQAAMFTFDCPRALKKRPEMPAQFFMPSPITARMLRSWRTQETTPISRRQIRFDSCIQYSLIHSILGNLRQNQTTNFRSERFYGAEKVLIQYVKICQNGYFQGNIETSKGGSDLVLNPSSTCSTSLELI